VFAADDSEFTPPEVGLENDETVVWSEKAGTPFLTIFCGGCLPMSSVLLIPFAFAFLGESIGLGVAFVALMGTLYYLLAFVRIRRTRYYLTTKRVIEVRGGSIENQMRLELFIGRPHSEFLQVKEDHRSGAGTYSTIRIYDIPSNVMIVLKGMNEDAVEVFKKIDTDSRP